jgi:transposase-like protein/transposase Tn5 family protein/DDE family transposase
MLAPWAVEEMKSADLNDERLNRRLEKLLSALGERPTASIPAACGGYAEMLAAYRFFDNDKVTFERVLKAHCARTRERVAAQPVVLLIQDTTELDFTRPEQVMEGAGFLDGSARRGALLHPLMAFTPDGTPLGTCWAKVWTRAEPVDETTAEYQQRRKQRPLEEKESQRWVEGLQQAREVAQQARTTQCICLADSEADIFELFAEPRGERQVEWIVRACQDRAVVAAAETATGESSTETARHLREAVEKEPALFTHEINVRGRRTKVTCEKHARHQARESRQTQVEVRAATVVLRGPWRPGGKLSDVTVNVVQVREIAPPAGDVAVEWLLITTLPISTVDEVRAVVGYYTVRFLIEVLFHVLKSGCRVEERRFEHIERMLPCAAIYLIVAWRTLMLCRLGRSCPDLDCEAVFDPAEWKSVWMAVKRKPPPRRPPPLREVLPLIAQLGGYVNYPHRKDPPGPQTVWLGLQRMYDLALAWNTFGPGASTTEKTHTTYV